jgi:hypothetical protein
MPGLGWNHMLLIVTSLRRSVVKKRVSKCDCPLNLTDANAAHVTAFLLEIFFARPHY